MSLTAVRTAPRSTSPRTPSLPAPTTCPEGQRARVQRPAARARRVRFTGRGRMVLLLAMVLLLLAAFAVGRSASSQATTSAPAAAPAATQVTVQPGDTLWSLAEELAPARDTREVVAQIRRLNDLPGAGLQAGQLLLVPAAA